MVLNGYIFAYLYALLALAVGYVIYRAGADKRYSRKAVHILVGGEWFILYHFLGAGLHSLIICLSFIPILSVFHFFRLTPMMSSDSDNAPGTVYFAVAMSLLAAAAFADERFMLPFGVAVMCTSVGDGAAGIVGQAIGNKGPILFGKKTLLGSVACFLFSLLSVALFASAYGMSLSLLQCAAICLFAAEAELITGRGLDNISVPVLSGVLAYFLTVSQYTENYLVPMLVYPIIYVFAVKKKALTRGGIAAAVVTGAVIAVCLGNFGALLLILFFLGGTVTDRIKRSLKREACESIHEKTGARDEFQVVSNAAVPCLMALLLCSSPSYAFYAAFVAAFAEALADTAASGIGMISKREPFDIFKMRRTARGLSGGVSLLGTAAALAAAFLLSFISAALGSLTAADAAVIGAIAFAGTFIDSALGSLLQAKYKCPVCGQITEKTFHCSSRTEKISGARLIDNDAVNLISAAVTAAVTVTVFVAMA